MGKQIFQYLNVRNFWKKITLQVEVASRKNIGNARWELLFRNSGVVFLVFRLLSTYTQE